MMLMYCIICCFNYRVEKMILNTFCEVCDVICYITSDVLYNEDAIAWLIKADEILVLV